MEGTWPEDPEQTGEVQPSQDDDELNIVVGVFMRLSIACKSRSLYPADHPAAQEAIHVLYSIMSDALEYIPRIEVQAIKDNLVFEDWPIGKGREGLRQLASRVRSLNIQEIDFLAGITKSEVEALVELLICDPVELEVEGGLEKFILLKGLKNIGIIESSSQLADSGGDGTPGNTPAPEGHASSSIKLPVVEAHTVSTIVPSAEEVPVEVPDIRSHDLDDLLEVFSRPEEMARSLKQLALESSPEDREGQADAIFEFLRDRSTILIANHPDLTKKCLRSVAESLLFLETDLRNMLLHRQLIANVWEDSFCADVLHQFNPQEISDLLCHFFPMNPELVPRTRDMLTKVGFHEKELNQAVELLRHRLVDLGEISPASIATLKSSEDSQSEMPKLPSLEEISASVGDYALEEMEEIKRISEIDLDRERLLGATPMLLDLINKGLRIDNLGRVVELLGKNFWHFVQAGELGPAAMILERIEPVLQNSDAAFDAYRSDLSQMVEEAGGIKVLLEAIRLTCERRNEDPMVIEAFKSYLSQLGERGITGMIDALGAEEEMIRRKYIIDILAGFGLEYLHIFGRYINDPRWYLVRNMVTIMAIFHSTEAIPYLRLTRNHPNPKVRAETIRALGLTGGYEATEMLIQGCQDSDESIKLLCIRWLGRLGEERAVGRLVKMLEGRDPGAESLTVKKEIIATLGEIRAPEAYQALKVFSNRQKLIRRSEWLEINEAARAALTRLVQRYPHLEGL